MEKILSGKEVSKKIEEELINSISKLKNKNIVPCLAILRIGKREDSISYEKSMIKKCEKYGIKVEKIEFSEQVKKEEVIKQIQKWNWDVNIHGIMPLKPLPFENEICNAIDISKDIDGTSTTSMANLYKGEKTAFSPCTPMACIKILEYYHIPCEGKNIVIIGRSLVVGKPLAMLLLEKNATVTICHSKTKNLQEICSKADILISAIGKANKITKEYTNKNQIVIDVGINVTNEGLCGDVDFDKVVNNVEAITPVPGGVGSVTTMQLLENVVKVAEKVNWKE